MNVIYARQALPKDTVSGQGLRNSIFLVGPTPRSEAVPSWRPDALEILRDLKFDGTVFVPEDEGWGRFNHDGYKDQVWWEIEALGMAAAVAIWLDRRLPDMPAFTTNTEVGLLLAFKPERLVLGVPEGAQKTSYQRELASDVQRLWFAFGIGLSVDPVPVKTTMREMLAEACVIAAR